MQTSLAEQERRHRANPLHFWTLSRVSEALHTGPGGSASLAGVSTDTRTITPGSAFLALSGEQFDGHDFADGAVAAGAAALIVSRAGVGAGSGVPVYQVADTLVALGELAAYRRAAWSQGRLIIGITGTNGKTSTKDLIAAALGARMNVHATSGNLNNRVGVPLTLLAAPEHCDVAVVEMGTSLPGEIATLTRMTAPQIAVVTSVGEGHLEGLSSLAGVLTEKASIFDAAPVAVVPAGQPEIAEQAKHRARSVISAGLGSGDVAATKWGLHDDGTGWLELNSQRVEIPLPGVHNLRNAMLALAVARESGVSLEDAARGMASSRGAAMRMEIEQAGELQLINDAYNSNPGSALAALEFLESVQTAGQRVVVLGTMRELGERSAELHLRIARRALDGAASIVCGIGQFADALGVAAPSDSRVIRSADVDDLWPELQKRLTPGSTILLKASRGVRLERMLPLIRGWRAG